MIRAIRVTPGAGKTRAAEAEAVDRARRGQRTAITFPTHAIARESVARLRAAGAAVAYRSSPPRVIDRATGAPICRRLDEARAVASSGLPVARELCRGVGSTPCPCLTTCPAAAGLDADPEPLVWVGPHALLLEAAKHAGHDGLLIVDEPADAALVDVVTLDDLAAARTAAAGRERKIAGAVIRSEGLFRESDKLCAVLDAAITSICEAGELQVDADLRGRFLEALTASGAPALARAGFDAVRTGRPVPGVATIRALARALDNSHATVAVEAAADDRPVLVVAQLAPDLRRVIGEVADVWLVDATLDVDALRVLGREVDLHDVAVADGAPIERVWLRCASATRRSWAPRGRVDARNLIGPLRRALGIVGEDLARRRLGIVTFGAVERELEAAIEGRGDLADVIAPWLARGAEVGLMHFGAVRGRNDFEQCDAVITLGDPRPDLVSHRARCQVLSLDFDASYLRATRDELAQAAGRIRAPHRTRPGLLVHVGDVLPGDWREGDVREEALETGRPRAAASAVRGDVLTAWRHELGLSGRAAAKLLGVDDRTLRRLAG